MRRILLGALLVLALGGVALAGGKKVKEKRLLDATEVEKNVTRLSEKVKWHRSLDEAKALAKSEQKIILWVHVLGDMEGAT